MTKETKQLHKRIVEQNMTIERQQLVIKTQYDTLQFILSGRPLWRLLIT